MIPWLLHGIASSAVDLSITPVPSTIGGLLTVSNRGGFLGRERHHAGAQAIVAPVRQRGDSGGSGFLDKHRPN